MKFNQALESGSTAEQQRENYEKTASGKVLAETSFFDKFLGRGIRKEEVIINDAEAEDKYRSLLNKGKIDAVEFKYLVENDIESKEGGLGIIGTHSMIEGIVHGNLVAIKKENHVKDDNYITYSYNAQINGQDVEMSKEEGEAIFNELLDVVKNRKQILDKIAEAEADEMISGMVK